MNNSIVVYRSEIERMQDEFWMDFMSSNASWLQYVIFGIFGIFILLILFIFFTTAFNIYKGHGDLKRRQEKYKKLF